MHQHVRHGVFEASRVNNVLENAGHPRFPARRREGVGSHHAKERIVVVVGDGARALPSLVALLGPSYEPCGGRSDGASCEHGALAHIVASFAAATSGVRVLV